MSYKIYLLCLVEMLATGIDTAANPGNETSVGEEVQPLQ